MGSITVKIHSPYIDSFDEKYFGLSPFTNVRNPWFNEFWEHKFSCQLPSDPVLLQPLTNFFDKKVCTGNWNSYLEYSKGFLVKNFLWNYNVGKEDLSEKYKQEPKLSFVIKAIKTMALGLHQLQQDTCGNNYTGPCPKMYPFNGTLFFVSFVWFSLHEMIASNFVKIGWVVFRNLWTLYESVGSFSMLWKMKFQPFFPNFSNAFT